MKVILMADVKTLGKRGDVVTVSDGHARNFLFPQNLAIQATEAEIKRLKDQEVAATKRVKQNLKVAGKLAQSLEGFELSLKEKGTDKGTLYAAVTAKTIAKALRKSGFDIEEDAVELSSPLKEPGEYTITVSLPQGFEAHITLRIEIS